MTLPNLLCPHYHRRQRLGVLCRIFAGILSSGYQALVLVNYGGGECHDLVALSERIRNSVYESFDIRLETEPLLL